MYTHTHTHTHTLSHTHTCTRSPAYVYTHMQHDPATRTTGTAIKDGLAEAYHGAGTVLHKAGIAISHGFDALCGHPHVRVPAYEYDRVCAHARLPCLVCGLSVNPLILYTGIEV